MPTKKMLLGTNTPPARLLSSNRGRGKYRGRGGLPASANGLARLARPLYQTSVFPLLRSRCSRCRAELQKATVARRCLRHIAAATARRPHVFHSSAQNKTHHGAPRHDVFHPPDATSDITMAGWPGRAFVHFIAR